MECCEREKKNIKFNVHANHLSILLKCRIWFGISGVRTEILNFSPAPGRCGFCSSGAHPVNSRVMGQQGPFPGGEKEWWTHFKVKHANAKMTIDSQTAPDSFIRNKMGASLVAQWLRICLPMQGTRVQALVWEEPPCCGATRPVSHNYWACASGACAPQQERPW